MTVTGLSASTTYYFTIKTSDEVPNISPLSNVPSLATTAASGLRYVRNGATTIDVHATMLEPGSVYYAVYTAAQPGLTASALKAAAQGAAGGSLVRNGTLMFASGEVGIEKIGYVTGLSNNTTYYVYSVGEGQSSGLGPVESFTCEMPIRHMARSFNASFPSAGTVQYWAYATEDYYKNPNQEFPILAFLHGLGQRGTDINNVLYNGPPMLINQGQELPFIVISPLLSSTFWYWPAALVDEIVENARSLYRVDPKRIYVTGLSLGGGGTFQYAAEYPQKVAAILPIAATLTINQTNACNVQNIPAWAFTNDQDPVVPRADNSDKMIQWINECSPPPNPAPITRSNVN